MKPSRPARMHAASGKTVRGRATAAVLGLLTTCLVAAAVLTATGGAAPSSAAPSPKSTGQVQVKLAGHTASVPACSNPSSKGALHIVGKRLLKANNTGFAYYGITVFGGLEQGGSDKTWQQGDKAAMAQIKAATWWHANTVRIQVTEADVFNNGVVGDGVNDAYLRALCGQVQQVRKQGEEVVISDQTEWPNWTEGLATARTVSFWNVVGKIYRNQKGVSYDLYNEPRLMYPKLASSYHGKYPKLNAAWIWKMWHNGGKAAGQTFVGMQKLYDDVRGAGDNNIIWIEGPYYDDTLGLASKYPIKGKNIVWSIHHPTLTNATAWNTFFGYLAKTYPMVDGEWGQYAGNKPECRAGAQKTVGVYLNYLRSHNIGMIGWSLQPGAMLSDPHHYQPSNVWVARDTTDPAHLRVPSRMYSNYSCSQKDIGEGAGRMLMDYFKAYSHLPTS